MAEEHTGKGHSRGAEPRSYGQSHHDHAPVDLNTASLEELASLPMVGRERAEQILMHRPFHDWDDVRKVPGFSQGMVDDLMSGNARLGSARETEH